MARIIIFLLCLLLRNNAYAACYAGSWTPYGPDFNSLYVNQGTTLYACQQLACQIYPSIPECGQFTAPQPTCQNQTEYQSLSCQPHYSGAINQSRSYICSSQTWEPWTTTSENCTPDPATCQVSSETQTLSCSTHFSGQIIQTKSSVCPDPYGQPVWGDWVTTQNSCSPDPATCIQSSQVQSLVCQPGYAGLITQMRSSTCSTPYSDPIWTSWSTTLDTCTMTATNLNNPTSPISPVSPTNPNSVISKSMNAQTTVTESVTVQDLAPTTTTTTATSDTANTSSTSTGSTTTSTKTSTSSTSSKTGSKDKKEAVKGVDVPKGKDLVPGFGIVMSMQFLNAGYNMQQEQMKEYINLIQEEEYGRQQNILLEFISANDTGDYIIRASANRWRSILRDNPLQRFDLDD